MAYAALRSLAQILRQTLNRDYQYLILDEKQQIESLVEKITSLQKEFSSQKITPDEETDIRDAAYIRDEAYIAEDIIESRIIERFRTESAGHEDGSTEKKLIRFDVIENRILSSSSSASTRSELEIVKVRGMEESIAFLNIYGIRQLARTLRFKAWFLDVSILDGSNKLDLNVVWALERLATHGTKIVIISSKRESETMEKLSRLGYDTSLFVGAIIRADDAWFEELGPYGLGPFPSAFATWYDQVATKIYKSAMVMAGVDAVDRCIAVGSHFRDIRAANAAGISSIFVTNNLYGLHEIADISPVFNIPARYDVHRTFVLRSFTW